MKNLYKRGAPVGWMPDADAVNAPEGALLRADNIVPDETGVLALRRGSTTLRTSLTGQDEQTGVHTIYSAPLPAPNPDGTWYDVSACGDRVYVHETAAGTERVVDTLGKTGDGDAVFSDDSYQIFMARGTDKKKWDGETLWNWPIPAPQIAATMAAATAIRTVIATFASTGDTSIPANTTAALTTPEGTSAFSAGYAGTSNTCVELTPNASTGRASYCKIWTADLDCYKILGNEGGQTDLIDFYVWLEEPRKVDKITIMFGLGTGTDPFIDDYYYFDFNIKNASTVNIKDSASYAAAAYTKSVNIGQSVLEPSDVTNIKTPTEVKEVLNRLGRFAGSRSRERQDSAQASPAWTHFTVTRGQFNRVGNTSGRSWSTVRGAKLIYIAVPGSTEKVRFDDLSIIGGGDRVFVGTFQCVYRFVRDNGTYLELSPVSPTSTPITLNQQTLSVSLSGAAMGFADPQVTQIWVYLFGGFLDTYYRVAVIQSQQLYSNFSLNEFDPTTDGVQDQQDMRSGIAVEFRILPGFSPTGDIILTVRKSELDVLIENVVLEPGAIGIPDNIVAIAGPWLNRLFCVTDEGYVYPTSSTSPSNCSVFHAIDLRRYGDPMWAVTTSGGVYVGFTKDVIRIAGSGDESADRSSLDLYPEPLNIGNPPVDRAVYTDGATVIYRSADGLMSLTGVTVAAVAQGVTSLLWRGYSRHNLDPLNTSTGRFRCVVDNQILYLLVTEGTGTSPTALWRVNLVTRMWSRTYYPAHTLLSLHRPKDGRLLAGTLGGSVLKLEDGVQDDGANIPVRILWPWADGGSPFARKVPFDTQIHANTGDLVGALKITTDGDTAGTSYPFSTRKDDIYRIDTSAVPTFVKARYEVTGDFFTFRLQGVNTTYRELAQQMMVVDTGYIIPPEPSDMAWLQEAEVDCMSASDLSLEVYLDDVLYTTQPVTVKPNVRSVYPVPLPRGTKGRRPRLLLRTTAADGSGQIGFECWRMRVRLRGSGNMIEIPIPTMSPTGSGD